MVLRKQCVNRMETGEGRSNGFVENVCFRTTDEYFALIPLLILQLGAGKGVLLYVMVIWVCPRLFIAPTRPAILQDIEHMHAAGLAMLAYYFLTSRKSNFQDVKKQDCHFMVSSFMSQLSAGSDACYNNLSKLCSDNIRRTRKPNIDSLKE